MKVFTVVAVGLVVAACGSSTDSPPPATMDTAGSSGSSGSGGGQATGSGGSSGGGQSGSADMTTGTGGSGGTGGTGGGSGGAGGSAGGAGGAGGSAGSGAMTDAGPTTDGGSTSKGFTCPAGPFAAPKAGASTTVCQGFKYNHAYNEGPAWIPGLNAFVFSNFVQGATGGDTSGDIIKYTPGGSCEIFISNVGCNGLALGTNGNIVGACHKTRSISEFDIVTKQPKILSDMFNGKMLDSPNDVVVASTGSIYFSNPTYELGGRPVGVGPAIFWRNPAGVLATVSPAGGAPNGVTLSADEKHLYVVGGGQWDLDDTGKPGNNKNYNFGGADGIATDCAGNIYSSGGSISNAAGANVGNFPGGTNLAFGGADGKTLIVVGGGTGVKTVAMNVPGFP